MPIMLKNPHKIRVILAIAVILFGMGTIGLLFTPYGNPPQCGTPEHPTTGDNCIIGANIGAGFILLFGLVFIWLGVLGLLASFAYRANQLHQQTKQRWLLAVTAVVFITPFILWHIFIRLPGNQAMESLEQQDAAFQEKYRSDFVEYTAPPNWNEVSKQSGAVAYNENSSLALYLNECEMGKSALQYANGSTYFVFSGVKDNACVFYIHPQAGSTAAWDGSLRKKCKWDLATVADDTPLFFAGPNGVEWGDFLKKNCKAI